MTGFVRAIETVWLAKRYKSMCMADTLGDSAIAARQDRVRKKSQEREMI